MDDVQGLIFNVLASSHFLGHFGGISKTGVLLMTGLSAFIAVGGMQPVLYPGSVDA